MAGESIEFHDEAHVEALVDLLDRYGWGSDLELLERMVDPHWQVVSDLVWIHTNKDLGLPSRETRRVVIERLKARRPVTA